MYRDGQDNHASKNGNTANEAKVVKSEVNDTDLYDAAIEPSGQVVKTESLPVKSSITAASQGSQSKALPALGVNQNNTGRRYCCYIGSFLLISVIFFNDQSRFAKQKFADCCYQSILHLNIEKIVDALLDGFLLHSFMFIIKSVSETLIAFSVIPR